MFPCVLFTEPVIIAKSNIILDVKPWEDTTDMDEMERKVRSIETDGLLWGACKYAVSLRAVGVALVSLLRVGKWFTISNI